MTNGPTIAPIVVFVVLAVPRIFSTVMIVACALTELSTQITIAKVENINPTVPCVKNSSLVPEVPLMKCLAVMQSIGNVSDNWQPTIPVALSAKRPPRLENV